MGKLADKQTTSYAGCLQSVRVLLPSEEIRLRKFRLKQGLKQPDYHDSYFCFLLFERCFVRINHRMAQITITTKVRSKNMPRDDALLAM
jgi:hypothetical protein